ncbi:hypothetical protein ACH5RR_032994 [Cinchona calisaya]|uniref:Ubiquitin-like domain-containing protein n=1 Tax=Cinchona calisaya TaxID=153742 RepID=A0ABD2YJP3_9GENT
MEVGQSSQRNTEEEEEIKICLKVMKTVTFTVKKSDTVRDVKARLNDKEGISECLQELFFTGERLRDDQRLVDCGIQHTCTLNVFVQNLVPIKLFIKIPSNQKVVMVEARICDTIQNVKSCIAAKEGISSHKYNLIYAGKPLEDEKTLASLNIQSESTLHMVTTPRDVLPISVKMPNGDILKIEVKMLYTVGDVKTIIESLVGFPLNDLCLTYHGEQLEYPKTLSCYGITEESILEMSPQRIQVFVKNWHGKTITVDVFPEDLVKDVKDKIFQKQGLPADVQSLVFEGKSLDNSWKLTSYNIQKHSTIHLALWNSSLQRPMRLSKIGISSEDLQSSMTVSQLKTMIQMKTCLPVKSLTIHGNMLEEELSITNYGIKRRTVITVVLEAF